jgi:putative ABC transport system permease protein
MAKKKQDSSYDGWDVNKVFVPFSAMRRDLPDKPPGTARTFDQLLVTPKSVQQHEACKHQVRAALARMHGYDPTDKEACPIWDTVQEAKAFTTMTDGMKYFLGAVGLVTLFLGGIGVMNVMMVAVREANPRNWGAEGSRRPRALDPATVFYRGDDHCHHQRGSGAWCRYGICALVNLLPMPDFFAGLVATWKTGLLACLMLGTIAVFSAMVPARRAASVDPIEALRFEAGG